MPACKWDGVVKGPAGWWLTGSSTALSHVTEQTSVHIQESSHTKSFTWSEPKIVSFWFGDFTFVFMMTVTLTTSL